MHILAIKPVAARIRNPSMRSIITLLLAVVSELLSLCLFSIKSILITSLPWVEGNNIPKNSEINIIFHKFQKVSSMPLPYFRNNFHLFIGIMGIKKENKTAHDRINGCFILDRMSEKLKSNLYKMNTNIPKVIRILLVLINNDFFLMPDSCFYYKSELKSFIVLLHEIGNNDPTYPVFQILHVGIFKTFNLLPH